MRLNTLFLFGEMTDVRVHSAAFARTKMRNSSLSGLPAALEPLRFLASSLFISLFWFLLFMGLASVFVFQHCLPSAPVILFCHPLAHLVGGWKEDRQKPKLFFHAVMLTNIHLSVIFLCSFHCL